MVKFFATLELRRAINELKLSGRRQYEIARAVGYAHPSQLTDLLTAARPARPDDPRVLALCRLVKLPFEQAFTETSVEPMEQSA